MNMKTRIVLVAVALGYLWVVYGLAAKAAPSWEEGRFIPVDSSVFTSVKYDGRNDVLTLLFTNGAAYEYFGVSRKTWLTLMRTEHKGSFFNAHIRRHYNFRYLGMAP